MRRFALAASVLLVAGTATVQAQQSKIPDPSGGSRNPSAPQEYIVPKAQKIFPTDTQWYLQTLNGKPVGADKPSLMLDGQFRARGFSGCNTYSAAAYPQQAQGFAVGPIAATKKACSKELMALEKQYLVAFRTARQWDTKDGFLILAGPGGEMRFTRGI
jgi:heat shock protein HslJ